MVDDSAWGDLFAKAADVASVPEATASSQPSSQTTDSSRKRSKKRKRKREESNALDQKQSMRNFLESRMEIPTDDSTLPHWLAFGGSLADTYEAHQFPKGDAMAEDDNTPGSLSQLYLRMYVSFGGKEDSTIPWPLKAFCILRNLRCAASLLVRSKCSSCNTLLRKSSNQLSSFKPSLWRELPSDEAPILESKVNDVLRQCNLLLNMTPEASSTTQDKQTKQVPKCFETFIRLIISSDALYYRLYYCQLTNMIPLYTANGKPCCLPNPSHYFGQASFVLDREELANDYRSFLKASTEKVDDLTSPLETLSSEKDLHPLALIHGLRQLEGTALFYGSGWMSSRKTSKLYRNSVKKFRDKESQHETPAPNVMMEWRDSCRDFLCNLYAYATLPTKALSMVAEFVKKHRLQLVEVGAGTGYIARVFQNYGVSIECWDIHPTDPDSHTMNDYHGCTPPFCPVNRGSQLPKLNHENVALFLCYPPPESSMAHDTLRNFLRRGGDSLIHIGEFKGLTGNAEFEALLQREMICSKRFPCLSWGADASHVTIWVKKSKFQAKVEQSRGSTLLLPCSMCNTREGKRRLRLDRRLVYCSKDCYYRHATKRSTLLRCSLVSLGNFDVDFDNARFFLDL